MQMMSVNYLLTAARAGKSIEIIQSSLEDRVVSNQPTSNLALRLVDCLPQQGSDWSIALK
jgi:hypothetical protein